MIIFKSLYLIANLLLTSPKIGCFDIFCLAAANQNTIIRISLRNTAEHMAITGISAGCMWLCIGVSTNSSANPIWKKIAVQAKHILRIQILDLKKIMGGIK